MRPDELDLDDACAVVATIGTTSTASIDPVPAIADACEPPASGSTSTPPTRAPPPSAPSCAAHFAGWERADSIVVNPHKWLAVPMDCSALWTRRPTLPRCVQPRARVPARPRGGREPQRGRDPARPPLPRAQALDRAALLRPRGLQARIREHVRLAELFEEWVRDEPGWEVVAPRQFSLVCFRRDARGRGERGAARGVNESGEAFLSHTRLDGRYVLRLAIGNARTTEDDVRRGLGRPAPSGCGLLSATAARAAAGRPSSAVERVAVAVDLTPSADPRRRAGRRPARRPRPRRRAPRRSPETSTVIAVRERARAPRRRSGRRSGPAAPAGEIAMRSACSSQPGQRLVLGRAGRATARPSGRAREAPGRRPRPCPSARRPSRAAAGAACASSRPRPPRGRGAGRRGCSCRSRAAPRRGRCSASAVQQLADDQERPALADELERVRDRAVLVVALHPRQCSTILAK